MTYTRIAFSTLCFAAAVTLTGCSGSQTLKQQAMKQIILVTPGSIGPLWHAGDVLTWQKETGSPDFLVYVLPRTCKESAPNGPTGPAGTQALPPSQTPVCTLLPQQKETPFVYYIGFQTPTGGGPTTPEGPFAARVGSCQKCVP